MLPLPCNHSYHSFRLTLFISSLIPSIDKATPVYFSSRVIDTVNSLPAADRNPISNALSMEFILGIDPADTLTPMQNMLYAMIRFYVTQDTERNRMAEQAAVGSTSFEPRRCALG